MQTRHTDARTQRERRSLLAELTVPSILKFPEFNSSTPPPFPSYISVCQEGHLQCE